MEKRIKKITLMVSQKEKDMFIAFAYSMGMDLSSLIRYLILKEMSKREKGSNGNGEDQFRLTTRKPA